MKRLGIDIGSVYIGCILFDGEQPVKTRYREHHGNIEKELSSVLSDSLFGSFDLIGITGNMQFSSPVLLNNTLCLVEGTRFLLPECRNVFAVGGETFSLILFDETGKYREHSINPPCASGTGSFIDHQAKRLSLSTADLARKAYQYRGRIPSIATRCAVFAKTDIVHAMQEGYSLDSVCAGLCEGIARNIADVLIKGRELNSPVAMVGGLSLNRKIAETLQSILNREVVVPEFSEVAGAVGAAVLANRKSFDLNTILKRGELERSVRTPLEMKLSSYPDFSAFKIFFHGDVEVFLPPMEADIEEGLYMGIDIGSTSTKAILINKEEDIAGGFYTATGGEPVKAVQKIVEAVVSTFKSEKLNLLGAGTTGSGRKMIKELFNADFEINEITAHAKAAVFLNPATDTIIEIGGQDSKFTRIRDGEVFFSTMNYVCAAGTGSFIEEQAKRLNLSLEEFSRLAFGSRAPYTSDRCTVYMERDLSILLSEGWSREALAASVLNSVRDNYLAKVVKKSPLGDNIVFQGATARNKALVACFEQLLNKPIFVSPYCHLTGALGTALLAFEKGLKGSTFTWKLEGFEIHEEVCARCSNNCVLTVAGKDGSKTGWGMKCGRDYSDRRKKEARDNMPLKRFRKAMAPLLSASKAAGQTSQSIGLSPKTAPVLGIPTALYNTGYAPLWLNFLTRLGFNVELTPPSRESLSLGKAVVNSDFCAPMILSHGLFKQLLDKNLDFIFCPAVENEVDLDLGNGDKRFRKKTTDAYFCYYSQYLPTIIKKLTSLDPGDRLISPLISFNRKAPPEIAEDIYREMDQRLPRMDREKVKDAFLSAYRDFSSARIKWRKIAEKDFSRQNGDSLKILLLGRPYVLFDSTLSLAIPEKIEELGAELYWQEELNLDGYQPAYAKKYYDRMHWHYGKQIVKASEYSAREENLFVVYLSCFRCSPDSFLMSYVEDIMNFYGKPFLILQLDEHASDVGYSTRIEAGLHTFRNFLKRNGKRTPPAVRAGTEEGAPSGISGQTPQIPSSQASPAGARDDGSSGIIGQSHHSAPPSITIAGAKDDNLAEGDTVLIPSLDNLMSCFWAACFRRAGFTSVPLDPDEKSLNTGYRYANGGECMPLVSIIGGVIEKVKELNLNPEKTFFYMPTVCMACNFPQFPILSDHVFSSAGLKGIKIGLINSMAPGEILPQSLSIKILESNIIGGILYKCYYRIKPYEIEKGDADEILARAREKISNAVLEGADLRRALEETVEQFRGIKRDETAGRKPRIGLLGDLYVKFNHVVNQNVQNLVHELGGELVVPSLTEYPFHFYDADVRLNGDDPRHYRLLRTIEKRYEKIADDLIGDHAEPDFAECVRLMEDYGIEHYIAGETSINLGRALYYIKNGLVDAILHINPMFCCPGVVTASVYRKLQEDYGVPIIDIFYDGTGNPNKILIPHLHYLKEKISQTHHLR